MFKKVLIANRGEIALRVIRTCKEMGIKTVAVYSTADKDSLHVKFADEAVCIGKPFSADSYLNIPHIMAAAEITNADSIHPGYGFLAENADLARACAEAGLAFIGPPAAAMEKMGGKIPARQVAIAADVPLVPGTVNAVETIDAFTTVDFHLGWSLPERGILGGTELTLDASNLLDADPPRTRSGNGIGVGDVLGRVITLGIRKKF